MPQYAVPIAMVVFGYPTSQQQERIKPGRLGTDIMVSENTYRSISPAEFQQGIIDRQNVGEDFEHWIKAFCKRKWNSKFSVEMSRSAAAMMEGWLKED